MTTTSPEASDRPAAVRRAMALLDADPAEAERLIRGVLAAEPSAPDARLALAAALSAGGQPETAAPILEALTAEHANWWAPVYELARVRLTQGRSREAPALLEQATALDPSRGAAWRLLGDLRLISGDAGAAQSAYDRMLAALLPDPRLEAAAAAFVDGRLAEAEQRLRTLLAVEPAALPAAHLMAEVLARQGRPEPAEALLAEVVRQGPGLRLAREAHALALRRLGRPAEALAELDILLASDPADHRRRILKAAVLSELGDYAGAAAVTASLLETFADQPHAWLVHGHGLRTLGRTAEAAEAYERAIALDPDQGEAYWSLANLKTYRMPPEMAAAAASRARRSDLAPEARAQLGFALGKAEEDAGRHEEAWARYVEANRLVRGARPYDPDALSAFVACAKALFTPDFFAARAGWGAPAPDPIFIVGLPRSGSTLVDQILCSHPAVEGAQELTDLEAIAASVGAGVGDPARFDQTMRELSAAACRRVGDDYLARTRRRRRLGRPQLTDKAPWNWRHIGLIQLALPNARIVDVRRHPLAACVSAYRQHFGGGFEFAYDLADLGRYYADYAALMAHVDAVLPGRVTRVRYEELVRDTEGEVRRLLSALGLPFDAACLCFFDTERPVATPSSAQVRRPVYRDALDDWRRFDAHLGPLKAALGPALGAYPEPSPAS